MVIGAIKKFFGFVFGKLLKQLRKAFVSFVHKFAFPFVQFYKNINDKIKRAQADLKKHREILYNNDNNLERNEVVNVGRIEGKIRKIQ